MSGKRAGIGRVAIAGIGGGDVERCPVHALEGKGAAFGAVAHGADGGLAGEAVDAAGGGLKCSGSDNADSSPGIVASQQPGDSGQPSHAGLIVPVDQEARCLQRVTRGLAHLVTLPVVGHSPFQIGRVTYAGPGQHNRAFWPLGSSQRQHAAFR